MTSPNKLKVKAAVRERDGHRCTECGMTAAAHVRRYGRNLDVHRVIPGSQYSVEPGVCVTLCRACHKDKPRRKAGEAVAEHGMRVVLPRVYGSLMRRLAAQTRRTLTAEASLALDRHLRENGIQPPADPAAAQPKGQS